MAEDILLCVDELSMKTYLTEDYPCMWWTLTQKSSTINVLWTSSPSVTVPLRNYPTAVTDDASRNWHDKQSHGCDTCKAMPFKRGLLVYLHYWGCQTSDISFFISTDRFWLVNTAQCLVAKKTFRAKIQQNIQFCIWLCRTYRVYVAVSLVHYLHDIVPTVSL